MSALHSVLDRHAQEFFDDEAADRDGRLRAGEGHDELLNMVSNFTQRTEQAQPPSRLRARWLV
jgi:hypothetical protein